MKSFSSERNRICHVNNPLAILSFTLALLVGIVGCSGSDVDNVQKSNSIVSSTSVESEPSLNADTGSVATTNPLTNSDLLSASTADAEGSTPAKSEVEALPVFAPLEVSFAPLPLSDNIEPLRSVYNQDGYDPVNVIRVDLRTVTFQGSCTAVDRSGCTLADVLADTDKRDDLTVDIPVHFSSDDFADDGSVNNAELRLRGGGSRFASQKSFRIKLDSKKNLWRGERYLQLNKHPFESSRMRNKLAMDLMSRVPHLLSFRTQFVNLWIDDGQGPVDYGLFTHVERANDNYLESRGLDKNANLYKAENFRFDAQNLSELRLDSDGKPLNKALFESSLGIEEGNNHRALVAMLEAINDPQLSFQAVLDKHFNRDNVLAWIAVNIMLKQDDATRHNFILYNPLETEKFYFLPWDYDATMSAWELPEDGSTAPEDLRARLSYGYALSSENVFLDRFYRLAGIHEEIISVIEYLRKTYIDDATIRELTERNAFLIEPFETRLPDSEFNPGYRITKTFADKIEKNIDAVRTQFSVPVPPTLFTPELAADGNWEFSWIPAVDVTGNSVSYDLQIATSALFSPEDVTVEITDIRDSSNAVTQLVDSSLLPDTDYYVRVIARSLREPEKFWIPARNRIFLEGIEYNGLIKFSTR